jgi:NAD(P)-dependent dehydrogenase (short-subunit alcohol dehydrogenase family)
MSETATHQRAAAPARAQAHTLFAQTMGHVAGTAALFALGAYLGRTLPGGAGIIAFLARAVGDHAPALSAGGRADHAAEPAPERPGAGGVMTGKVAIITGACEGIGAGLVARYRRRGWAVVATARAIKPSEDPEVLAVEGDIADPASADRIIGGALERFGRIDTLVNNAGVCPSKPFTDYTAADYARAVGVDLTGFFWVTQRAIDEMARRYGGHVVNVTATLAEIVASGTPAVLAALTKGALAAATRSLAIEYAAYGIRVNAVSPVIIATPAHPAESYEHLGDRLPLLGRAGQVSDVVDAILFLESSPFITGEILHIDGGHTASH